MTRRAGIIIATVLLCFCAFFAGCSQTPQRQSRAAIDPVWSHRDQLSPASDATAKVPQRKPLIESLLSYVPLTPFN